MPEIRDIILRELVQAPFTTKGSELEWEDMDGNLAALGAYLIAIETSGNIRAYAVDETYEAGAFVTYDSKLWRQINAGSPTAVTGVTPGTDGTKWARATAADFVHEKNRDTQLVDENGDAVTATALKAIVDSGAGEPYVAKTYAELYAMATASPPTLEEGYGYKITAPTNDYDSGLVYVTGNEVVGPDGFFYKSLQDGNQNKTPASEPTWWARVYRNIFLRALSTSQLTKHGAIIESDYGSPATDVVDFVLYDVLTDTVEGRQEDVLNKYGLLYVSTTQTGTPASTDETTLASYTLPGGTLAVDGGFIEVTASGSFAANGNVKSIKVYFESQFFNTGATSYNNKNWQIVGRIYRTGAATQKTHASFVAYPILSVGALDGIENQSSLSENLTTDLLIRVTGTNGTANANDIVIETFTVEHKSL